MQELAVRRPQDVSLRVTEEDKGKEGARGRSMTARCYPS